MVVTSREKEPHVADLEELFTTIARYRLKLNPEKCIFGVEAGKFLGFLLTERGIEANPEKCAAIVAMRSPTTVKEVQQLTGRLATLSRFMSAGGEKGHPYFQCLKRNSRFLWTQECEEAFIKLKEYLASPPVLRKPQVGTPLRLYFAVTERAVSSVLVLKKPDVAGRMVKWAVELSEFDIQYEPRGPIKGQVFADFVVELSSVATPSEGLDFRWVLSVDGSSNQQGSGAGVILEGPNGVLIKQSLRFAFKASNNQAEYEALIAGMLLAREMGARSLVAKSDSLLVTGQVTGEFQAKDPQMAAYLEYVQLLKTSFTEFELVHVPREQNARADLLAKLASSGKGGKQRTVIQETLKVPRAFVSDNQICVYGEQCTRLMSELHEGVCGSHVGGCALASRILRAGYYWPTLKEDCVRVVEALENGAYRMETLEGGAIPRTWNATHLKFYFS
ncbi:uncharacterized protein [Phaseolus vulgaris]|uniref:uncharacterized protein n=1 Tax=Phaseolus vulgaris TaxID=3885 RepID=UPI0035CAA812